MLLKIDSKSMRLSVISLSIFLGAMSADVFADDTGWTCKELQDYYGKEPTIMSDAIYAHAFRIYF